MRTRLQTEQPMTEGSEWSCCLARPRTDFKDVSGKTRELSVREDPLEHLQWVVGPPSIILFGDRIE
jgi:hypothetical protein